MLEGIPFRPDSKNSLVLKISLGSVRNTAYITTSSMEEYDEGDRSGLVSAH